MLEIAEGFLHFHEICAQGRNEEEDLKDKPYGRVYFDPGPKDTGYGLLLKSGLITLALKRLP